jgi:hypothetical protein
VNRRDPGPGDGPPWMELWDAEARRKAVLAHPDLAAQLTVDPLGYAQPDQWSGYVPPERWNGQHNDSPRRAALAEITEQAWNRTEHRRTA